MTIIFVASLFIIVRVGGVAMQDEDKTKEQLISELHKQRIQIAELKNLEVERIQTQEELKKGKARLRAILEDQTELICRFLPDGILTFVNDAYCRYFDKKREELVGHSFMPLIPDEDQELVEKQITALCPENPVVLYEHRIILANGEIRWQQWSDRGIFNKMGDLIEYQSVGRDITKIKQTEEALRSSEKRLNGILQSLNDVIWSASPTDNNLLYMNPAGERLYGRPIDQFYTNPDFWLEVIHPEDRSRIEDKLKFYDKDWLYDEEYRIVRPHGEIRWVREQAYIACDNNGNIIRLDGIINDITEQKWANEFLQDANNKLELSIQKRTKDLKRTNDKLVTEVNQRKRAEKALKHSIDHLHKVLDGTVNALALTAEKRDPYTSGHQQRVSKLAVAIGKEFGLSKEQIKGIRIATTLHDIGKMYVPAEILSKPGQLTYIETLLIKTHPRIGYDIVKTIPFEYPVAKIILQHHERIDGSGYPSGLLGRNILLEAKILAVADVVEAMASHRPYRPAQSIDKALSEIEKNKGILYDPDVVDLCLGLFRNGFQFVDIKYKNHIEY